VMGSVDPESEAGAFRPSAKRNFLKEIGPR
jgi:hypothetical protein